MRTSDATPGLRRPDARPADAPELDADRIADMDDVDDLDGTGARRPAPEDARGGPAGDVTEPSRTGRPGASPRTTPAPDPGSGPDQARDTAGTEVPDRLGADVRAGAGDRPQGRGADDGDGAGAAPPGPRSRRVRPGAVVAMGAAALATALRLTGVAAVLPGERAASSPPPPAAAVEIREIAVSAASLDRAVEALQARLRRLPKDHQAWARLGSAYVQQARITADPSYYTKAEQAPARAAALAPGAPDVLTGQAALAAGRHEFAQAVRLADQALEANPYGAAAYGVRADALTQLGRDGEATAAIEEMMRLRPGVASFTRASYAAELRGDVRTAEEYLRYALRDATDPEDVAYCRHYLGELALHSGDLDRATREYDAALAAVPGHVPALAGRARALALSGGLTEAAAAYQEVVNRLPLAQYLVEYGEVLRRLGRDPSGPWALLDAQRRLMASAGVRDDLTWAEFEADHGSAERAVRHARAEYARNPNLVAADALAWALYRAGRPKEAIRYAEQATSTGWRNALLHHHRAVIERALGRTGAARRSAALVKQINPRFDPELPALARFS